MMAKPKLYQSVEYFAEESAFYQIENKRFRQMLTDLFGRLYQNYPGQFMKLKQKELYRYPQSEERDKSILKLNVRQELETCVDCY